jgi:phosphoglycerate dehydrogenase-like enzyme
MTSLQQPICIAFLDDDHVVRLARDLLAPGENAQRIASFFAPERVDPDEIVKVGRSLHRSDGVQVRFCPDDGLHSLRDATALVFRRGEIKAATLDACPHVRLIQRLGESSAGIDLMAARARNIQVSCLHRPALVHVAEHVMMLALALSRRLREADSTVREGPASALSAEGSVAYNWAGLSNIQSLSGKTLGIVGLGEVGAHVARRARAFGMRLLYTSRSRVSPDREQELGVTFAPLDDLLATSDVISLHAQDNPENRKMIGAREIGLMRAHAVLINTARGTLVDEHVLLEALLDGRIAGAGFDVHPREPRGAHDRLCSLPNVILTPHMAGGSRVGVLSEIEAMFDNIRAAHAGKTIPHARIAHGERLP